MTRNLRPPKMCMPCKWGTYEESFHNSLHLFFARCTPRNSVCFRVRTFINGKTYTKSKRKIESYCLPGVDIVMYFCPDIWLSRAPQGRTPHYDILLCPSVQVDQIHMWPERVAVISAKNQKRQRRKRQSVTAKWGKSQTPKFITAIQTSPNLTKPNLT